MGRKRLKKVYREKNSRRIDLIRKQHLHGETLSAAEAAELQALQGWVDVEVDRVYGSPSRREAAVKALKSDQQNE